MGATAINELTTIESPPYGGQQLQLSLLADPGVGQGFEPPILENCEWFYASLEILVQSYM